MDDVLNIIFKNGMSKSVFMLFVCYFLFNVMMIYAQDLAAPRNCISERNIRKTYWILLLKSSYMPAIIGAPIATFVRYILIMYLGYRYYSILLLYTLLIEVVSSFCIYSYNYPDINKSEDICNGL